MSERSLKDLVGETVIDDIVNVTRALKLQELVKERIRTNNHTIDNLGSKWKTCDFDKRLNLIDETKSLQSLVEESEK